MDESLLQRCVQNVNPLLLLLQADRVHGPGFAGGDDGDAVRAFTEADGADRAARHELHRAVEVVILALREVQFRRPGFVVEAEVPPPPLPQEVAFLHQPALFAGLELVNLSFLRHAQMKSN